jgi:hypothetical protein
MDPGAGTCLPIPAQPDDGPDCLRLAQYGTQLLQALVALLRGAQLWPLATRLAPGAFCQCCRRVVLPQRGLVPLQSVFGACRVPSQVPRPVLDWATSVDSRLAMPQVSALRRRPHPVSQPHHQFLGRPHRRCLVDGAGIPMPQQQRLLFEYMQRIKIGKKMHVKVLYICHYYVTRKKLTV